MSGANPLIDILEATVEATPEATFLTDIRGDVSLTYRNLRAASRAVAKQLAERGIGRGDRVAYLTRNNPFFYPLFFACAARGAVMVPLGAEHHDDELRAVLADARPALVFHDEQVRVEAFDSILACAWNAVDLQWINIAVENCVTKDKGWAVVPCAPGDEALVIYTSGTTQSSKGIVLTHGNLDAMSATFVSVYPYSGGRRFLCVLPFYHINAPMLTGLSCIRGGAHVVLAEVYGFTIARFFWKIVADRAVNVLSLTPSIMASLLDLFPGGAGEDLSSVEYAMVGTAQLDERLWREFEERFGFPCYQGYGLTETTAWATMTPPDERKRYDTAGLPFGCEVRIRPVGGAAPLEGRGLGIGEILIRGDCVMKGYSNPKAGPGALCDGWFRSGDLGYTDEDGQLVVVGRIKNIIKRKGNVIYPEEIDGVLLGHVGVRECTTIGIRDRKQGELIVSACVPESDEPGLARDLRRYVFDRLSAYKCPDRFELLADLPRNQLGKVHVANLRKLLSGEKAREIIGRFNTQKIRRARSPDIDRIEDLVQGALLRRGAFEFAGYWGVGAREELGTADRFALERLRTIVEAVNDCAGYPMGSVRLILADLHGRSNEVKAEIIDRYLGAVGEEATRMGFETELLSSIWERYGLDFDTVVGAINDPVFEERWASFPLREDFVRRAARHCDDTRRAEEVARRYHAVTHEDRQVLTRHLDGCIFFTYGEPEFRGIQPELPVVFWYSLKKGVSERPWFIGD